MDLKTFTDNRGNLTVLEDKEIPFSIKRIFYIYMVLMTQQEADIDIKQLYRLL